MLWLFEIGMNGQLVGFPVRRKLTPDENFYMVLGSKPRIIVHIDLPTKSGQFSAPSSL